nr:formylglycine-generating enzyme family protein [Labilithrix luteola]
MGSPADQPERGLNDENQVQVTITHAFVIQQYETTQSEWTAVGFPNPSTVPPADRAVSDCLDERCPVGNIDFYEAVAYANARSRSEGLPECYQLDGCTGVPGGGHGDRPSPNDFQCASVTSRERSLYECKGYRLPMEAEWEYAARAGTSTATYAGTIRPPPDDPTRSCYLDETLDRIAWYCFNSGRQKTGQSVMHPVGLKEPNGWGLYDVLGNATEWCNDAFDGLGYGRGPLTDPDPRIDSPRSGVVRGGGAACHTNTASVTTSRRCEYPRSMAIPGMSFRLVRSLNP